MSSTMLIRFCAYTLLFAMTLQSLYRSIMTVEYHINLTEYIAQCLNTDRPELLCNGRCILMDKIHQAEDEQGKNNTFQSDYSSWYLHKEVPSFLMENLRASTINKPIIHSQVDYLFNFHTRIFRPPIA